MYGKALLGKVTELFQVPLSWNQSKRIEEHKDTKVGNLAKQNRGVWD